MKCVLSVVVSVYKEEGNLDEFLNRTIPILQSITPDFEIIFSLDPSPDRSEEIILRHRQNDPRIKLITFSRRVGQPMATLAGLKYSSGDAVVVMDVDLQDPPELIKDMMVKWREGYDVVFAQRRSRKGETLIKRMVAYWGYKVINRISEVSIPPNTGDFRLLSRRVVNELNQLKESHGFLRGLVALVGYKQTSILFDRPERFSGSGNYNRLFGSLRIGFNGLVCFSSSALSVSSVTGIGLIASSIFGVLFLLFLRLAGVIFSLQFSIICLLILFIGGIQLLSVGILGEYISRIYDEVKQRPKFIVDSAYGFESTSIP